MERQPHNVQLGSDCFSRVGMVPKAIVWFAGRTVGDDDHRAIAFDSLIR